MIHPNEFFEEPRSWSILKLRILEGYLSQYFPKVNQYFGLPAVVADLFAGKGRFDNGDAGSPIIIARQAKLYRDKLGINNKVILAESVPDVRRELIHNVQEYIQAGVVEVVEGEAAEVGHELLRVISPGVPLFVFLDPFGVKGLSMSLLLKLFERARAESTEVLINFNHRAISRHLKI